MKKHIFYIIILSLCIINNTSSQVQEFPTTLFQKDLFVYGFDNETSIEGASALYVMNRLEMRTSTQFGIIPSTASYSKTDDEWLFNQGQLSYISLTYIDPTPLAAGSILELNFAIDGSSYTSQLIVLLDGQDISNRFNIEIVGNNKGLLIDEPSTVFLYQGNWFETEGKNKILGHVIEGVSINEDHNESDLPNEMVSQMTSFNMIPNGTNGGPGSVWALFNCDGNFYLCDVSELLDQDDFINGEGSRYLDTLNEEFCDQIPPPCILEAEIVEGAFDCNLWQSLLVAQTLRSNAPPLSYNWEGPNGFIHQGTGFGFDRVVVTDTGNYSVTITDQAGCTIVEYAYGVNYDLLTVDLGDDIEVCYGDDVVLTPTIRGGNCCYDYVWFDGTLTYRNTLRDVQRNTEVWIEVTDDNGCTARDTVNIEVIQNPEIQIWDDRCIIRYLGEEPDEECSVVVQSKSDDGIWIDTDFKIPFENCADSEFRLKLDCECGVFYSASIATNCERCTYCADFSTSNNTAILNIVVEGIDLFQIAGFDFPYCTENYTYPACTNGTNLVGCDPFAIDCAYDLPDLIEAWLILNDFAFEDVYFQYVNRFPQLCASKTNAVFETLLDGTANNSITSINPFLISDCVDDDKCLESVSRPIIEIESQEYELLSQETNLTIEPRVSNDGNFILYPNPTDSYFEISALNISKEGRSILQIYSMSGALIKEKSIDFGKDSKQRILTDDVIDGLYVVLLKTMDQTKIFKVAINHK